MFFVDPFERFIADPEHFTVNRERWAKPWLVKVYPHNALLVGTSKLAHVNPDDIDTGDLHFFNASVAGGTPEEMYTYLDRFSHDDKLVIISYDLMAMSESIWAWQPHDWQQPAWLTVSNFDYILGSESFSLSLNYLIYGRPPSSAVNRNGSRDVTHDLARSEAMPAVDFAAALKQIYGAAYADFRYSARRAETFERTARLLQQRGIPYIVLISPENRQVLDLIRSSGKQWALDRFRVDVKHAFPEALDYSDSWVSDDRNFFKFDPMHYLPAVGAKMIREAMHKYLHAAN